MKPIALLITVALTGCVSTTTTTTAPDGSSVTVKTEGIDPASVQAISTALQVIAVDHASGK